MKIEIVNEEGKKEEIDIVFMLKEKIVDEHRDEWNYDTRMRQRENFYTFTDLDVAVLAFAEVISREARQKSRMAEHFQAYGKPESDFVFESVARQGDALMLEEALYKQHILGRGENEPDIISLWNEQQENQDWQKGRDSCNEFIKIFRAYDTTIDEQEELDNARGLLIQMFENHDWETKSAYKDCIRTVQQEYRPFYKRTMQMIVLRNIWTTTDNWKTDVECIEYHRYNNSERGKREIAEQEERHRDMMTYMGESGLSSYSVDSNGTYTMWRD